MAACVSCFYILRDGLYVAVLRFVCLRCVLRIRIFDYRYLSLNDGETF